MRQFILVLMMFGLEVEARVPDLSNEHLMQEARVYGASLVDAESGQPLCFTSTIKRPELVPAGLRVVEEDVLLNLSEMSECSSAQLENIQKIALDTHLESRNAIAAVPFYVATCLISAGLAVGHVGGARSELGLSLRDGALVGGIAGTLTSLSGGSLVTNLPYARVVPGGAMVGLTCGAFATGSYFLVRYYLTHSGRE